MNESKICFLDPWERNYLNFEVDVTLQRVSFRKSAHFSVVKKIFLVVIYGLTQLSKFREWRGRYNNPWFDLGPLYCYFITQSCRINRFGASKSHNWTTILRGPLSDLYSFYYFSRLFFYLITLSLYNQPTHGDHKFEGIYSCGFEINH